MNPSSQSAADAARAAIPHLKSIIPYLGQDELRSLVRLCKRHIASNTNKDRSYTIPPGYDYVIITDGGNECNIPPHYGDGYGSLKINDDDVCRVEFHRPMSNNAAELWTMDAAIGMTDWRQDKKKYLFISDSQIALKYAKDAPFGRAKPSAKSSDEMLRAIKELRRKLLTAEVSTCWWPRHKIFSIFGH